MSTDPTSDSENVAELQRNINKTKETNTFDSTDPEHQIMDTNRTCIEKPWISIISRIHNVIFKTDTTRENQSNGINLINAPNYYYVTKEGYSNEQEQLLDTLTMIDLGSESMCLHDIYKEQMIYRAVKHNTHNTIVKNCNTTNE